MNIKSRLKALLKEMIPVILGILIALFISNWKEQNDKEKFIHVVMNSISAELKENKSDLETSIKEHELLLDTINFYKENEGIALGNLLNKVNGIQGVSIRNTAWKTLMNSRIDLIEYDKISLLTDIDEGKTHMIRKLERLTDLIYERISSTNSIDKELFGITVNDLLYIERELLKSHQQFMELKK